MIQHPRSLFCIPPPRDGESVLTPQAQSIRDLPINWGRCYPMRHFACGEREAQGRRAICPSSPSPQAEETRASSLSGCHPAPGGRQILTSQGTWSPLGHLRCLHTDRNICTHTPTLHPHLAPALHRRQILLIQSRHSARLLPFLFLRPTHHHTTIKCNGRNKRISWNSMKGMAFTY